MANSSRQGRSDDYSRRLQSSSQSSSKRPTLNEYWIEGEGINRQVLQSEICKYLGAEATCRPGDYNGQPGFKIKALRPFTPEMVDDLKVLSREYMLENRALRGYNREEVPYEDSETRGRRDPASAMDVRYTSSPTISYNVSSSVSSPYSDASTTGYSGGMPPSIYNPGSGYPPSVSYSSMAPQVPGMSSHVAAGDSRYQQPSNYTYGQPPRDTNYPPQYGYPQAGGYQDPPRSMHPSPGSYYAPTAQGPSGVPRDPYYDSHMSGVESSQPAQYRQPGGQPPYNPMQGGDYSRQRTNEGGYGRR